MKAATNICDNADYAWLDHLSVGGGIAVAAIAICSAATVLGFFWLMAHD